MLTCVEAKTVDCEVCLRGNMEERTLKTDEPRKTRNWQLICTFISTLPQEGMLTDLVTRQLDSVPSSQHWLAQAVQVGLTETLSALHGQVPVRADSAVPHQGPSLSHVSFPILLNSSA